MRSRSSAPSTSGTVSGQEGASSSSRIRCRSTRTGSRARPRPARRRPKQPDNSGSPSRPRQTACFSARGRTGNGGTWCTLGRKRQAFVFARHQHCVGVSILAKSARIAALIGSGSVGQAVARAASWGSGSLSSLGWRVRPVVRPDDSDVGIRLFFKGLVIVGVGLSIRWLRVRVPSPSLM
jgi:hypothetical protein